MEIIEIIRKGRPLFVKQMKICELNKDKLSHKFLRHNFPEEMIVNVKCLEDGTLVLRGKKEQYRIIVPDDQTKKL